jgi:hypothetical protein
MTPRKQRGKIRRTDIYTKGEDQTDTYIYYKNEQQTDIPLIFPLSIYMCLSDLPP